MNAIYEINALVKAANAALAKPLQPNQSMTYDQMRRQMAGELRAFKSWMDDPANNSTVPRRVLSVYATRLRDIVGSVDPKSSPQAMQYAIDDFKKVVSGMRRQYDKNYKAPDGYGQVGPGISVKIPEKPKWQDSNMPDADPNDDSGVSDWSNSNSSSQFNQARQVAIVKKQIENWKNNQAAYRARRAQQNRQLAQRGWTTFGNEEEIQREMQRQANRAKPRTSRYSYRNSGYYKPSLKWRRYA